jgi:DNA-binding MarR family transcriptional regulator
LHIVDESHKTAYSRAVTNRNRVAGKDALLDAVGTAFSKLRRRTTEVDVGPAVTRKDHTRILVITLVDEADDEITVGAVADRLGVDASVASRMVSDCISAGLLRRTASQGDGRRTVLQLTEAGEELRDRFRDKYRQTFEFITRDWAEPDRLEFVRLLLQYVADTDAIRGGG